MSAHIALLKLVTPFLDPHVLLKFLKEKLPGSDSLQAQIKDKLLISNAEEAGKKIAEAKEAAGDLLALLQDKDQVEKLKNEEAFTLTQ